MNIFKAGLEHLDQLAILFDQYRQFYKCDPDIDAARTWLQARMNAGDNIIYAAERGGELVGFTQIYPSFCSIALKPVYILYDLYVAENARKEGVGAHLMNRAKEDARKNGIAHIALETATDNLPAQGLYEKLGYVRDGDYFTYHLDLTSAPHQD